LLKKHNVHLATPNTAAGKEMFSTLSCFFFTHYPTIMWIQLYTVFM